jgi:hypothetical protein
VLCLQPCTSPFKGDTDENRKSILSTFQHRVASGLQSVRHGSNRLSQAMASAFGDNPNDELAMEPGKASVPPDEIAHHHFPPLNSARASFGDSWHEVTTNQGVLARDSAALSGAVQQQLKRMQLSHMQHGRAREALNTHLPLILQEIQSCLVASRALQPQLTAVQQQLQAAQLALQQWQASQRRHNSSGSTAVKAKLSPVSPLPVSIAAPPVGVSAEEGAAAPPVGVSAEEGAAAPPAAEAQGEAPGDETSVPSPSPTTAELGPGTGDIASAAVPNEGDGKRKKKRKGGGKR